MQEIGQQLEAAALAMRMAMEADANTGMDDSPSGNGAQHSTSKAAEKESKQVRTVIPNTGFVVLKDRQITSQYERSSCLFLHIMPSH